MAEFLGDIEVNLLNKSFGAFSEYLFQQISLRAEIKVLICSVLPTLMRR